MCDPRVEGRVATVVGHLECIVDISAGAVFIFWFGKPHMTTLRDTSNDWLKRKLNSKLGLAEDQDPH